MAQNTLPNRSEIFLVARLLSNGFRCDSLADRPLGWMERTCLERQRRVLSIFGLPVYGLGSDTAERSC